MTKSSLACLFAVLFSGAVLSAFPQTPIPVTAPSTQVVDITADKYEFTPAEIHVKQGTRVQLKVRSVDKTHGLKLNPYPDGAPQSGDPGLRFEKQAETGKIKKSESADLIFFAQKPGVYEFKCSVVCGFGHGRMKGKLIVDE